MLGIDHNEFIVRTVKRILEVSESEINPKA